MTVVVCRVVKRLMKFTENCSLKKMDECKCSSDCNFSMTLNELQVIYDNMLKNKFVLKQTPDYRSDLFNSTRLNNNNNNGNKRY